MESCPVHDEHDIFEVPPEQIIRSSKDKGWNSVDIAEIVHPDDDFVLPAIPRHVLVVNLGSPAEIREQLIGRQGHLGAGNLVIMPAGAPSHWHLERHGEVRHLHLYLAPTFIKRVAVEADLNPDRVELLDVTGVSDPQIEMLALSFLDELCFDGPGGKLYTESLANVLAIQLLRRHSSQKGPALPRPAGLSASALKRVIAAIEERLADDLSLAELASLVHLSPYYFARLFKHSTGLAPHQYLIRQRIERAKFLLQSTNWSIAMIALTVGFVSESHLALHFKRLTGLTPKHYRR